MSQLPVKQTATVLSCIGSDVWKEEVKKVIPKEIALEAMLRVARSTASDTKFASCDPKSFLLALLKCGRAGLYPDGREAHLIPFGKDVQTIFDVKGICALARRAGILVTPKVVFSEDEFTVEEDDGTGKTRIVHRVDYRQPRGQIQAVYSRAVMPDGQVDYEIMSAEEVEAVRKHYSKAKDSTPWKNSWGEMAKKTVIKRHSKRWDMSPEIRQALNADDDTPPPFNEPRITTPIFASSSPARALEGSNTPPTPSNEPPAPGSAQESPIRGQAQEVRELYARAGVTEKDLIEFANAIGVADDDMTTLEQVFEKYDTAAGMLTENVDDFSQRIKDTP